MKPITLVRVCNWDRQSGKTTFIVNDAIQVVKNYPGSKVIIFEPDNNQTLNVSHKLEKIYENYSEEEITYFRNNIDFENFASYLRLYKLGKCKDSNRFTHIYLDEVNYFPGSFEEIIHCLQNIKNISSDYPTILTVVATRPNKSDFLKRSEDLIKTEKEWINGFE